MNNTTTVSSVTPVDATLFYQYAGFGAVAVFANVVIVGVLFTKLDYFKKSAFVFCLALGDMINGLALIVSGLVRVKFILDGTYGNLVHPFFCITNNASYLYLLGNQIPSMLLLLIGCERVTAVYFYKWYFQRWSNKLAWTLACSCCFFCFASAVFACLLVYFRPGTTRVSNGCQTPDVIGTANPYNVFNYTFGIICGTAAITLSIIAMVILIERKKKKFTNSQHKNVNKKEWQITKAMLCVAGCDFVLVVLPNVFVMLRALYNIVIIPNFTYYSVQIICFRSALNLVVYFVFNQDFRKQALGVFGSKFVLHSSISGNAVTPAAILHTNR